MAEPTIYVSAPERSPRRGGIRSVAEFIGGDQRLAMGGVLTYTSPGCQLAVGDVTLCYPIPEVPADPITKVPAGVDTLVGIGPAFGLYAGVECFLNGSDYEADADRLLTQGEDRGIEEALATWAATAVAEVPAVTGIIDAIATAENHADGNYVARPVLLMNRGDAVWGGASRALSYDSEGNMWTANGTPVLASASFPTGSIYATGALAVHHSNSYVTRTQNLQINTEMAIAERAYAIAVDCDYIVRVDGTTDGASGFGLGGFGQGAFGGGV